MHVVWERTCAASSAAFSSACRTKTNGRTAKPGEGPDLGGGGGGAQKQQTVETFTSRLWARRTRVELRSVGWGRSAGVRCETQRRRTSQRSAQTA
jgi:hypothetical protein